MSLPENFVQESVRDLTQLDPSETETPLEPTQAPTRRPSPLVFKQDKVVRDSSVSYDTSYTGSPSSGYFSNMSSPEILSASRVEYFGSPTEVNFSFGTSKEPTTPIDSVSRQSSQSVPKNSNALKESKMIGVVSPASPFDEAVKFIPEVLLPEIVAAPNSMLPSSESERESPELKRASIAAFEVLPIGELRAINVGRRSSYSSNKSLERVKTEEDLIAQSPLPPITNRHHTSDVKAGNSMILQSSPASLDGQDQSPLTQSHGQRASVSKSQFKSEFLSARPKFLAKPRRSSNTQPPIHASTPSPKSQKAKFTSSQNRKEGSKSDDFKERNKSYSTEDQLNARITSILDEIPTRIKLTSASHVNPNRPQRPRGGSGSLKGDPVSPAMRLTRAQTSTPLMKLSSTSSKVQGSGSPVGESEVKVYHLHQPGKDVPIKLYIRLVGENGERVMVRVGGGWADLGEYLKEYANHHGHRSISEGKFEIQGLPSGPPSTPLGTLAGLSSGSMTPTNGSGTPISSPTSSIQVRKLRFSGGSPIDLRTPNTPDAPSHKQREGTPGSTGSFTSRRQSFHTPLAEDDVPLGLAGCLTNHVATKVVVVIALHF